MSNHPRLPRQLPGGHPLLECISRVRSAKLPRTPLLLIALLGSCSLMSETGPRNADIKHGEHPYELIEVKTRADLPSAGRTYGMGEIPKPLKGSGYSDKIRARDALDIIITDLAEESPFHSKGTSSDFGPVEVPEDGKISIPYLGEVQVMNRSLSQVSSELNERLRPISSTARAAVGRTNRIPRTANVIGEVKHPGLFPLERSNISSVDLLAASGGPTQPEYQFKYTLRRAGRDYTFDYAAFRAKAFPIEEGDVLNVATDTSNRFYVLGALNKPNIVPFPGPAPTLADAISAATGFDEKRSDPSGVFVFRKGNPDQVFTLNLKDPSSMFLSQRFPIRGEDLVYITEAPLTRWNRLVTQMLPVSQALFNIDRITSN